MNALVAQNKQTNRSWLNALSLLRIDGTAGQYVSIPNKSYYNFTSASSFTIAGVACITSSGFQVIAGKREAAGYNLFIGNDNTLYWELFNTTGSQVSVTCQLQLNRIYHYVATYSSITNKLSLYINGMFVGESAVITGDFSNSLDLWIGKHHPTQPTVKFWGLQGFVTIFNKSLSASEVNSLFNEIGLIPKLLHANVVGYWTLQEKSGAKAYDYVGAFRYTREIPNLRNAGFDTDTIWTKNGNWVIADGVAKVNTVGTANSYLQQNVGILTGHTYKITFTIKNYVAGILKVSVSDKHSAFTNINANGTYTATVSVTHALADAFIYFSFDNGQTCNFEVDDVVLEAVSHGVLTPNHGDLVGYASTDNQVSRSDFYTKKTGAPLFPRFNKKNRSINIPVANYPAYPAKFSIEFAGSLFDIEDRAINSMYNDAYPKFRGLISNIPSGNQMSFMIGDEIGHGIDTNFSNLSIAFNTTLATPKHLLVTVDTTADSPYPSLWGSGNKSCDIRFYVDGAEVVATLGTWQAFGTPRTGQKPFNPLYFGSGNLANTGDTQVFHQVNSSGAATRDFKGLTLHNSIRDYKAAYSEYKVRNTVFNDTALLSVNPTLGTFPAAGYYKSGTYYTDAVVSGSGLVAGDISMLETKTGLPEIAGCVTIPSSDAIQFPTTTINNGTAPFGLHIAFWMDEDVVYNGSDRFFFVFGDGFSLEMYKNRILIHSNSYFYEVLFGATATMKKGLFTFAFQVEGRKLEAFVNGIKTEIQYGGDGTKNTIVPASNPWYFRSIGTNYSYMTSGTTTVRLVNYGAFTGNLAHADFVELYGNSKPANPPKLSQWLYYYQFNTDGSSWVDLTGKTTAATRSGGLTSTTINSLR